MICKNCGHLKIYHKGEEYEGPILCVGKDLYPDESTTVDWQCSCEKFEP